MLEAVIPVSDREESRRNLDRLDVLLKSLNFFWTGREALPVHIVAPDQEIDRIGHYVESLRTLANLNVILRSESDISPVLATVLPTYGVMKQMLVKLAAFDFVKGDYCLTLDTDVVACKHFSTDSLIFDGRVLTEWLTPSLREWWYESAKVLGYDITRYDLSRPRMFVTPQILCRPVVSQLRSFLSDKFGADWLVALIGEYSGHHPEIWTEYTLYDLYADRNNLLGRYHIGPDEMPNRRLHCLEQSIWNEHQFEKWTPTLAINGNLAGYFLVLQSITAHALEFDLVKDRWTESLKSVFPEYPE